MGAAEPGNFFNGKDPHLHGSGQIFERSKTCTYPPFVYTVSTELGKFLNRKVCKFFTWSEVGQNF